MTNLDLAVFLVAGVVGVVRIDDRLAWGIVAVWSLLKLLKVI
jgi:hypothetical protein